MPLSHRTPLFFLATMLSFSAFAGEETRSMNIDGSSGKYFSERSQACTAAQTDAQQTAQMHCERDHGQIQGPLIFSACECDQGGFQEQEWLCSTTSSLMCTLQDASTSGEAAAVPATDSSVLELSLPAKMSKLELLDRTFDRRGFTLPSGTLLKHLDRQCTGGWKLVCKTQAWKVGEAYSLSKASKDLETACGTGDDDACIAYGWSLEERALATNDGSLFRAAARRYKSLCDAKKNGSACYDYGSILFNELGVKADPRLGIRRWESACELGENAACSALAKVHRAGIKTPINKEKAASFANKACAADDPAGCVEQALLMNDKVREQHQLARACSLGSVETCWSLASAYLSGERAEPVAGRTRALLEIGCDLGDGRSCNGAGDLAMNDGDHPAAAKRFRTACAVNNVAACISLADLVLTERIDSDVREEPYAFEVACSKGDMATACSELGLALLDKQEGLRDQPRARALLRQSCTNETSPAKPCFVLGDLYETGKGGERDRTLASQYYKWACAQGWGQACERRGTLLANGVGVRLNEADAVFAFHAGCDAGLASSCHKAAVLLNEGTHIPRDVKRAYDLFEAGCARGVADACLRLGNLAMTGELGRDEEKARKAYETAVGLGNVEANRRLAYLLWNGIGGKKDKRQAKALTATGCQNDDPIACRGPAFQTED